MVAPQVAVVPSGRSERGVADAKYDDLTASFTLRIRNIGQGHRSPKGAAQPRGIQRMGRRRYLMESRHTSDPVSKQILPQAMMPALPRSCQVGVETKYHEHCKAQAFPRPERGRRYLEIADLSGVFRRGAVAAILGTRLQQIFLDHLLVLSFLHDTITPYRWAKFVLVYPNAIQASRMQPESTQSFCPTHRHSRFGRSSRCSLRVPSRSQLSPRSASGTYGEGGLIGNSVDGKGATGCSPFLPMASRIAAAPLDEFVPSSILVE